MGSEYYERHKEECDSAYMAGWNFNVLEERAEQMAQEGRKPCQVCGRVMCDHMLEERGGK